MNSSCFLRGPSLRPRLSTLTAALLGAGLLLGLPAQAQTPSQRGATATTQQRHYDIGPAPLAEVLNRFAAEAGVVLVFDAASLRGLSSRGLQGAYGVQAGFDALLAGTPLQARPGASGGYLLERRPPAPSPAAEADAQAAAPVSALPVVRTTARLPTVEQLDRPMLRNLPTINGDLTSQLKLNPNIQYSETALSSNTAGEIAPAEISIHGAKPYQNQITIDGVSVMNDLDPGRNVPTESVDLIPGSSQSLAIDSSILCQVEVQDSNVSAEHGRFTGGLVEAKVCAARKKLGGSVGVGYTSSDWTHVFIDPARRSEFENSATADLQPRFTKWTYRTTVETRPTSEWGLLISAVRRQSEIPLKRFATTNANTTESREVTQQRQQDTLVLKTDYAPQGSAHRGELTMVYAPSDSSYFLKDFRDSDYTIKSGGLNLSGRLESRYEAATLTHQLSLSRTAQSRRSDADYHRNWRWSTDKNWGDPTQTAATSGEGAFGDIDQNLQALGYQLKSAFKPMALGETRHRVAAGLELRRQRAEYERLSLTRQYTGVTNLPTALANCQLADGSVDTEACSSTPTLNRAVGQYFTTLQTWRPGRFDLSAHNEAAFVEDEISWRQWSLRAGLRADRDSVTGDTGLSPRLRLGWHPLEAVSLDLGANRYRGRSLFAYALQEKINTLKTIQTRRNTLVWGSAAQSLPENRLEDMKTPYDDELTAGLTLDTPWLNGPVSLRLTHRNGRDQVVKRVVSNQGDCNNNRCYIYTNDGKSRSTDWTLSWSNATAFKTGPVATRMWVAFNKSDVTTNYATYADNFGSDQLNDVVVQYNGRFMRYSELPADNYNRPWTLRVGAMSSLPAQNLTVTNILRIRDRYEQVLQDGTTEYEGATVDVYRRTPLPRSLALDTVIQWEPRLPRDQRLSVKLTLENITNRRNKIAVNDTYATYERGRAVALDLSYDF
ncbi:TonB-dependent receptor plug domain-containing protein [Aquincola tertiaricarbonis]|uniref:TonB-dependent receptor plug domain-containing protein n=1 Tax=Aquincola tertiaricarbonis TaxID=391953 RepID=A0ABY4S2T4_AQUTE|nr:TonB-dependent receptor plug domain-containing protein [Aquincola tertiaricarbonis]URI06177.1 TonB-dependent receptor plug domain-containing protein [Aquincola tertiaricarbonis]